jgi:hypothetical protein
VGQTLGVPRGPWQSLANTLLWHHAHGVGAGRERRDETETALDLHLVTCLRLPEPDPDAAPLAAALEAAGIEAAVRAWDDPAVDWSAARLTVLRSCWDYPRHPTAFRRWVETTAAASDLWNPLPVVRWSIHKGYLLHLEAKGVAVAPTALLPQGATTTLDDVCQARSWQDVVVKPAVAAASFGARRFARGAGPEDRDAAEAHLQTLLAAGDVLVQPYLPSVADYGERALIWVDGQLTHAVRKSPRFDGEDESVSAEAVAIAPAEEALALAAIAAVGWPLLYARVDLAPGADGQPVVMELELVEPSLFFDQGPQALERFVAAVRARL